MALPYRVSEVRKGGLMYECRIFELSLDRPTVEKFINSRTFQGGHWQVVSVTQVGTSVWITAVRPA